VSKAGRNPSPPLSPPGEAPHPHPAGSPFPLYRAVFDAAPDGILIVDSQGMVRDVNRAALELLGYSREDLVGFPVEQVVPPDARAGHPAKRSGFVAQMETRPMGVGLSLRAVRKDGRQVPVEVSLSSCATSDGSYVIAAIRDVSERKRLRTLGVGTLRAAEEERQRIARELHDDTAQCLAALLVRLRVLGRTAEGPAREALLNEMQEALADAVEGVRRISRGLRPPALADVGLAAAIRAHVRGVLELSSLDAEVAVEVVDDILAPEEQLVLYRVIQEALTNVVRHAEAEAVEVSVTQVGEAVVARVADDGRGFDAAGEILSGEGLGLVGMEERARLVGGNLEISSAPGEGTRVELRLQVGGRGVA
jgi:PAS domain S-box-containing protein